MLLVNPGGGFEPIVVLVVEQMGQGAFRMPCPLLRICHARLLRGSETPSTRHHFSPFSNQAVKTFQEKSGSYFGLGVPSGSRS